MFYFKLAKTNLKKNSRIYTPFLLSIIFLVVMNVVMQVLLENKGMDTLQGADSAKVMFGLGSRVIIIFTLIFSIYTNSFLLKQRKKEFGLYNILGMGKSELTRVLFWESLLSYVITLVGGLVVGTIFSRLCFLVLGRMIQAAEVFKFEFSVKSYLTIVLLFAGVFLVLFLLNVVHIRRVNPIDLLKGGQKGEKEPKTKWISAILGIGFIVAGYIISVTIESPLKAINLFFIAVILVIVGTYSLFMSSSIMILKFLKNKKGYYYQPNHFISVSSMIYRMKQNAAGLASISILCTMVLVTLSTTGSLYLGMDNLLRNRNPYDFSATVTENSDEMRVKFESVMKKHNVKIKELKDYTTEANIMAIKKGEHYELLEKGNFNMSDFSKAEYFEVMTQAEYEKNATEKINLAPSKVALYSMSDPYEESTIKFGDLQYDVQNKIKHVDFLPKMEGIMNMHVLVMANKEDVAQLVKDFKIPAEEAVAETTVFMNIEGSDENRLAAAKELKSTIRETEQSQPISSMDIDRKDSQMFIGGFLFLGLIFGITFTLATGIIIYYKQISEGYQDQERFSIMQRVGMSHKEVKNTIHGQILMVFFFPIALAAIHLVFAFPMIDKLLMLFGLSNTQLFLYVSLGTIGIFLLIYLFMYWQTSKVYYSLVERQA
ncbi:ABC transporter permease [Vagococcus silagei]|uniref:ABC transporter permease n=1 Tax=Vagococcus silagei TaxID=2508885 RepID=A0A4S3B3A2_9ENTE|nr:ABC transporter permease [Vagococcus silagei]THB60717.1 ABC transporter permease [Vagococcus silagei]